MSFLTDYIIIIGLTIMICYITVAIKIETDKNGDWDSPNGFSWPWGEMEDEH